MILVDSNAFVILVLGLMDKNLINKHKRTSIYEEIDYYNLIEIIGDDLSKIITLPNIWAEVDNLLNDFKGNYKYQYYQVLKTLISKTTEEYFETKNLIENYNLFHVGVTDSIVIEIAKKCEYLVTADSLLSDLAISNGVKVYDLVSIRNERLK